MFEVADSKLPFSLREEVLVKQRHFLTILVVFSRVKELVDAYPGLP